MKVVHICIYPGKGEKHVSDGGVAGYEKNLLTNMPDGAEHYVLADRKGADEQYEESGVKVIRCFDKSYKFISQLNRQLKKINPDVIHVQHELTLFGGLLTAYLLPLLILMWRKKVTLTLHGVVGLSQMNKAFATANNYSAPVWAIKAGLMFLYWPLAHFPRQVVVHEPYFKHVLVNDYGANGRKISVIPHGIEDYHLIDKSEARKQLDIGTDKEVVLFMGYAAGYKGIDLLIEGFAEYAKQNPNAFLVIGAGVHPKLKDDPNYQIIYVSYQQKAEMLIPAGQFRWVGFIPEELINTYYSAADVSVYPYTLALSSSGPMAFAIGHNRPFVVSHAFSDIFAGDFVFRSTPRALANKLKDFFEGQSKISDHVNKLKQERLWPNASSKTMDIYKKVAA